MRVTTTYQTVRGGELTRCESLAILAVAGEDMELLHRLARKLTAGVPVRQVLDRLLEADTAEARHDRTARVIAEAEALAGRHEPQPEEPAGPEVP